CMLGVSLGYGWGMLGDGLDGVSKMGRKRPFAVSTRSEQKMTSIYGIIPAKYGALFPHMGIDADQTYETTYYYTMQKVITLDDLFQAS
ncbi:MAG: hypothetical protein J5761_00900, partial [Paludibacteraceae bacterium]|nr:hypothetical protein [Paludibacteraceae bacterium]